MFEARHRFSVSISWTGYEGYESVRVAYLFNSVTKNSGLTLVVFRWSSSTLLTLPSVLRRSWKLNILNRKLCKFGDNGWFLYGYAVYNIWVKNIYMLLTKENNRLKVEPVYISYTSVTVWLRLDTMAKWEITISCLWKRKNIEKWNMVTFVIVWIRLAFWRTGFITKTYAPYLDLS